MKLITFLDLILIDGHIINTRVNRIENNYPQAVKVLSIIKKSLRR